MPDLLDLLCLSVAALLGSAVPLVLTGHRGRGAHLLVSLLYLVLVLMLAASVLRYGFDLPVANGALLAGLAVGVAVVVLARHWNAIGQAAFAMALLCVGSYLAYVAQVTLAASPGPVGLAIGAVLITLIAASLSLLLAHTFEIIDVLCRIRWRRHAVPRPTPGYCPRVSLHVPTCNEPPDMVIQTLDALAALDYPAYEVIVVDNNTTDPELWKPVRARCHELGFRFFHLGQWPGYKSGALNFALSQTAPDVEVIGVVDADYIVERDYLRDLTGFFRDSATAFVQTPQDYRDFDAGDRYALALYRSYQYFFRISMTSRNERNGIIFTGTMGLIRRAALERVGGWDEWCITEDAEVALRLLHLGYESVYVERTYGRGLMPLDFEGLRRQRFRWAFGGMQVLRLHWKKLLPFSRLWDRRSRLTFGQKCDYWSGAMQWLNDPIAFMFTLVLIGCAIAVALDQSPLPQPIGAAVVLMPFLFIGVRLANMLWALSVRLECPVRDAHRAFLVLLSLAWVVTMACAQGLARKQGVFLRTPKSAGTTGAASLRTVAPECAIVAIVLATTALVYARAPLEPLATALMALLIWQVYIYGSAVVVLRWSRAGRLSKERGHLHPAVHSAFPVGTALVAEREAQARSPGADLEQRPRPVTVCIVPGQTTGLGAEREVVRHCATDPRAAP